MAEEEGIVQCLRCVVEGHDLLRLLGALNDSVNQRRGLQLSAWLLQCGGVAGVSFPPHNVRVRCSSLMLTSYLRIQPLEQSLLPSIPKRVHRALGQERHASPL